jgi:hypothetical protein
MKGIPTRFVILALLLETLFLLLRWTAADPDRIVTAIVILLLTGALFVIAAYVAVTLPTQSARPVFRFIIAAAIVYRITLWPLAFPSTDDAYRYRWEGKLQWHGGNPFEARPADAKWESLRDETYPRVGLKDFKGGYGPAWELISAATYRVVAAFVNDEFRQTFWFKVPAALADLGVMAAVVALLRAYGMSEARVLVCACPAVACIGRSRNCGSGQALAAGAFAGYRSRGRARPPSFHMDTGTYAHRSAVLDWSR